jgi:hypothetical protein
MLNFSHELDDRSVIDGTMEHYTEQGMRTDKHRFLKTGNVSKANPSLIGVGSKMSRDVSIFV